MSLLFNMLSRLVITFLPRSKRLLILWLHSPSVMILEPKKYSLNVSIVFPAICHEVMGPDAMILVFWMLSFKFSKPGFNSMWTINFQMFKVDLEMAEEPEIKLPTSIGSSKKQKSSRKISTSAFLTTPKPLTVWITTNCGKFLKRWE